MRAFDSEARVRACFGTNSNPDVSLRFSPYSSLLKRSDEKSVEKNSCEYTFAPLVN